MFSKKKFQVVPPCGGHPRLNDLRDCGKQFQVVPPCGGHLILSISTAGYENVSSRAPVWGASFGYRIGGDAWREVSSRAPVWGASAAFIRPPPRFPRFKSCPRVGGIHFR